MQLMGILLKIPQTLNESFVIYIIWSIQLFTQHQMSYSDYSNSTDSNLPHENKNKAFYEHAPLTTMDLRGKMDWMPPMIL